MKESKTKTETDSNNLANSEGPNVDERQALEVQQIRAQISHTLAHTEKIQRETYFYPFVMGVTMGAGIVGALVALATAIMKLVPMVGG